MLYWVWKQLFWKHLTQGFRSKQWHLRFCFSIDLTTAFTWVRVCTMNNTCCVKNRIFRHIVAILMTSAMIKAAFIHRPQEETVQEHQKTATPLHLCRGGFAWTFQPSDRSLAAYCWTKDIRQQMIRYIFETQALEVFCARAIAKRPSVTLIRFTTSSALSRCEKPINKRRYTPRQERGMSCSRPARHTVNTKSERPPP